MHLQLDQTSPIITRLQQQYNVTIAFKQRPRSPSTIAVVRGTIINIKALKEATVLLMEHLTGNIGVSSHYLVRLQRLLTTRVSSDSN